MSDARILYNEDGETIDEIVHHGYVHLEQMDDGLYWMGVGDSHFWLRAVKRGRLDVTCPDGSESHDFPLVQRHMTAEEFAARETDSDWHITLRGTEPATPEQAVATRLAIDARLSRMAGGYFG